MSDFLAKQQRQANSEFKDGHYVEALSSFTALRELRARQEGTASPMYLSNTHSMVYCLARLNRWEKALPLAKELSTTRDRMLSNSHEASIDAKKWWSWVAAKTTNYERAATLQIELADIFLILGDVAAAERAIATAIFYQNKISSNPIEDVEQKIPNSNRDNKLIDLTKSIGNIALQAGVTAAFEGLVGGYFKQ